MASVQSDQLREKLRITIVSAESLANGYAPFSHTQGLKSALAGLGHQVALAGKDDGPYHDVSLFGKLKRYFDINRMAIKALKNSDLMIARAHFAHLPWVLAAGWKGTPVIHEMNGLVFDAATTYRWLKLVQPILSASYHWQFRKAAGVACITEQIANHLRSLSPEANVEIVKNGVDPAVFFPSQDGPRKPQAVFPSALTPWHGVDTVLAAVEHPSWPAGLKLVIVGDGVRTNLVMEKARTNKRIQYLGLLPRAELAKVLREAEIGLCLVEPAEGRGVTEVFPLKLFEMMASGLPIVATDLPGQREIVEKSGIGIIAPLNDAASLAQAIADLYRNPRRRDMGASAASVVANEHSWHVRSLELQKFIYRSLAKSEEAFRTDRPSH